MQEINCYGCFYYDVTKSCIYYNKCNRQGKDYYKFKPKYKIGSVVYFKIPSEYVHNYKISCGVITLRQQDSNMEKFFYSIKTLDDLYNRVDQCFVSKKLNRFFDIKNVCLFFVKKILRRITCLLK